MNIQENLNELRRLNQALGALEFSDDRDAERKELQTELRRLQKETYKDTTAWDKVQIARYSFRPNAMDYIEGLFTDFIELHGDRLGGDDASVVGGLAWFGDTPVTVIGQCKGKTLEENIKRNFGMCNPEGYRKTLRLMKQAEKFGRPVIALVDTSGAYPGLHAEAHGQGEAIARNLLEMSRLRTPVITIVISEGGSGGALALSVADYVMMLEHGIYSVLSPEGFASILWKDASRAAEAAEVMKLTSQDLLEARFVDEVIKEPIEGIENAFPTVLSRIKRSLQEQLKRLQGQKIDAVLKKRYKKFREIGGI